MAVPTWENTPQRQIVQTPNHLARYVLTQFGAPAGEVLDPCPLNPMLDGLSLGWGSWDYAYVNPPFKDLLLWWDKIRQEFAVHNDMQIMLLFTLTGSQVQREILQSPWCQSCHYLGRVRFVGKTGTAPSVYALVRLAAHKKSEEKDFTVVTTRFSTRDDAEPLLVAEFGAL